MTPCLEPGHADGRLVRLRTTGRKHERVQVAGANVGQELKDDTGGRSTNKMGVKQGIVRLNVIRPKNFGRSLEERNGKDREKREHNHGMSQYLFWLRDPT